MGLRICFQIFQQQIRGEDHPGGNRPVLFKQGAEAVAPDIGQILLPEEGIAEGQPGEMPYSRVSAAASAGSASPKPALPPSQRQPAGAP